MRISPAYKLLLLGVVVHASVAMAQNPGTFTATGIRPKFADKLKASGINLPANLFEQTVNTWH